MGVGGVVLVGVEGVVGVVGLVGLVRVVLMYYELLDLSVTPRTTITSLLLTGLLTSVSR